MFNAEEKETDRYVLGVITDHDRGPCCVNGRDCTTALAIKEYYRSEKELDRYVQWSSNGRFADSLPDFEFERLTMVCEGFHANGPCNEHLKGGAVEGSCGSLTPVSPSGKPITRDGDDSATCEPSMTTIPPFEAHYLTLTDRELAALVAAIYNFFQWMYKNSRDFNNRRDIRRVVDALRADFPELGKEQHPSTPPAAVNDRRDDLTDLLEFHSQMEHNILLAVDSAGPRRKDCHTQPPKPPAKKKRRSIVSAKRLPTKRSRKKLSPEPPTLPSTPTTKWQKGGKRNKAAPQNSPKSCSQKSASTTNDTEDVSNDGQNAKKESCRAMDKLPETYVPWETRFDELVHFQRGYGHCRVPFRYETNPTLARWVQTMRREYKLYSQKQQEEQIKLVEAGVAKEGGELEAPEEPGGVNKLTKERIKLLEGIGFEWHVGAIAPSWEERYNELIEFKKEHGHTRVPRKYPTSLGEWCHTQRNVAKRGPRLLKNKKLMEKRMKLLNDIGFNWTSEVGKMSWEERFEQLVEFRREHGHCDVPVMSTNVAKSEGGETCLDGTTNPVTTGAEGIATSNMRQRSEYYSLAIWARTQRSEYAKLKRNVKSNLNRSRVKKLDDIGFNWGLARLKRTSLASQGYSLAELWQKRYEQLLEYKARFGNTRCPQYWKEDPGLNRWVNEQRKTYMMRRMGRPSGMTDERQAKLEAIGFEWSIQDHSKRWNKLSMQQQIDAPEAAAATAANEATALESVEGGMHFG